MPNYNKMLKIQKKSKLNSTESPNRVKAQLQKPNLKSPNSKCQTTIKSPKYKKPKLNSTESPNRVKAQLQKPLLKAQIQNAKLQ
jgi:hypothetical protein